MNIHRKFLMNLLDVININNTATLRIAMWHMIAVSFSYLRFRIWIQSLSKILLLLIWHYWSISGQGVKGLLIFIQKLYPNYCHLHHISWGGNIVKSFSAYDFIQKRQKVPLSSCKICDDDNHLWSCWQCSRSPSGLCSLVTISPTSHLTTDTSTHCCQPCLH